MFSDWLRDPVKRARLGAYVALTAAVLWAAFRIARSMQILFSVSHDGFMYYVLWFVIGHRDVADIGLRQALYLPHTFLFLTPFFAFGWPVARVLLLLLNVGAIVFIWLRLSKLAGLEGLRRWLFLAFFCSWLGTGLVVGLGNLALVCVAFLIAAFPADTTGKHLALAFSALKQSLVFPVYLHLLFKRPRALVIPTLVFAVSGIGAMFWTRLSPLDMISMAKGAVTAVGTWTTIDHLCLRRLFALFIANATVVSALNWLVWFGLFALTLRIKDPLCQFAALLIISLLPLYHKEYDMVAVAPALAIFLKRCNLAWPALMTVLLASNIVSGLTRVVPGAIRPLVVGIETAYYPVILILFVLGLFWLDTRDRVVARAVPEATGDLAVKTPAVSS